MKLYLCLTAPDPMNRVYTSLFKLSLDSAIKNTTLDIQVLYSSPKSHECLSILREYQTLYKNRISVINHEFAHKKFLPTAYSDSYLKNRKYQPHTIKYLAHL